MSNWQFYQETHLPKWFLEAVKLYHSQYATLIAQLLWQRGICDLESLEEFIHPDAYSPTSGLEAFGQQMSGAIKRLQQAWETQEKVTIWGDFDADGVTATSVLWEGLKPFFPDQETLSYYVPNRLTESHGLNEQGLEKLAANGVSLVITCDTGSTNLREIKQAKTLGIDVIITDHHTLPLEEPEVIAILNPKYLTESHPLYALSGVAVAYKLVEALYECFPEIPDQPVENLLDLVAIGLVADLVELRGDCRYLAQKGIEKLAQQREFSTRPGVAELLKLCRKNGDRPMDISFGIGPRINAISRIQGDASFAVELLTSKEEEKCLKLAQKTDLANTRRKEIQKEVEGAVKQKIEELDLSTTGVIVLADAQWPAGVLGLVAGQIAQEYARPTILLCGDASSEEGNFARGSARSVQQIDLYELLRSQTHLLHRFGGHPFAAGLSIKAENISLFRDAINQQFRQIYGTTIAQPSLNIDLTVTVETLGKDLFQGLKLLEPYGMGNPLPRLLIKNCWFTRVGHTNIADYRGRKIKYIRTHFKICDETKPEGFPGMWWGHYKEDLPENKRFDAVVELDVNTYKKRYEVRLVEVKRKDEPGIYPTINQNKIQLFDRRSRSENSTQSDQFPLPESVIKLEQCPRHWEELSEKMAVARQHQCAIALAYSSPDDSSPEDTWKKLLGIAMYLSRTGQAVTREKLSQQLDLSEIVLEYGLRALNTIGLEIQGTKTLQISGEVNSNLVSNNPHIQNFLETRREEQFRCEYFSEVPLEVIENTELERLAN